MLVPSILCQTLQLWGDVLITLIIARTKLPDKKKPKEGEGLICLTVSTYTLSWQAKERCGGQLSGSHLNGAGGRVGVASLLSPFYSSQDFSL